MSKKSNNSKLEDKVSNNTYGVEPNIYHLDALREDARDEIKRRIEQRDRYSIQLVIALSAIFAVSLYRAEFFSVLTIVPLVSWYFTSLILYSYDIHYILAEYLRDEIEPLLSELCNIPKNIEWQNYYEGKKISGIRREFFIMMFHTMCVLSFIFLSIWYLLLLISNKGNLVFIFSPLICLILYLWTQNKINNEFSI